MWQNENKKGMAAFIDGDEALALQHWKQALDEASAEGAQQNFEFGETSFYVGKILSDNKQYTESIPYLRTAVEILTTHDTAGDRKNKATYILAHAYRQLEKDDEFKAFMEPFTPKKPLIPLKDALKLLQKQKLAADLKGTVLTELCSAHQIDSNGDAKPLTSLLHQYYADPTSGAERKVQDKFFSHATEEFDIQNVLDALADLIGKPGKIKIVENTPMPNSAKNTGLIIELGKASSFHEVETVYHIVWAVNELLEEINSKVRFQEIDDCPEGITSFYLLKESAYDKLVDIDGLEFTNTENYD
ncbi:MAG TPA: hypothetical protein V6C89_15305 [Drouetiella sp.]